MCCSARHFDADQHPRAIVPNGFWGIKGMSRATMERMKMIASADAVLHEMQNPSGPGRRLSDGRTFNEPREGLDVPAQDGSFWTREM